MSALSPAVMITYIDKAANKTKPTTIFHISISPGMGLFNQGAWLGMPCTIRRAVCICGLRRPAALQILAIATAIAALYALQPLPIRSAHSSAIREEHPLICRNTNHIQCMRLWPARSSAITRGHTGSWACRKRSRTGGRGMLGCVNAGQFGVHGDCECSARQRLNGHGRGCWLRAIRARHTAQITVPE